MFDIGSFQLEVNAFIGRHDQLLARNHAVVRIFEFPPVKVRPHVDDERLLRIPVFLSIGFVSSKIKGLCDNRNNQDKKEDNRNNSP